MFLPKLLYINIQLELSHGCPAHRCLLLSESPPLLSALYQSTSGPCLTDRPWVTSFETPGKYWEWLETFPQEPELEHKTAHPMWLLRRSYLDTSIMYSFKVAPTKHFIVLLKKLQELSNRSLGFYLTFQYDLLPLTPTILPQLLHKS